MNVLAVGAHYDDVELGCSGTLINHIRKGDEVTIVVITDSAYKDPTGNEVRAKEIAEKEGRAAADLIGADLICLEYKTFEIPFDEALTKELTLIINKRKVDTIYSQWVHDVHRDHQYTGRSTMMAGRHVPRFLMYRSNYYDSHEQFRGNYYSDISDVFDAKIDVIKSHESELKRVRNNWIKFFENQNSNDGDKIGVEYAECFEIVRYLHPE